MKEQHAVKQRLLEIDVIHHADFFDLHDRIADDSIDLVVCDGPYAVTDNRWDRIDDIQNFNLDLIKIFSRKMKTGGALYLFGKDTSIDFIDCRPYLVPAKPAGSGKEKLHEQPRHHMLFCERREVRQDPVQPKREKPRQRLGRHQAINIQVKGAGEQKCPQHDTETGKIDGTDNQGEFQPRRYRSGPVFRRRDMPGGLPSA